MLGLALAITSFHDLLLEKCLTNPSLVCLTLLLLIVSILKLRASAKHSTKVFLIDFTCYKPPITQSCTKETYVERAGIYGNFTEDSVDFIKKTLERSGLGPSTYGPRGLLVEPPTNSLEEARFETEMVIFGAVDQLLAKTRMEGKDIGIVIVNCTMFNVIPSLSAMIVNRYKIGDNVLTYDVTGMGCSSSLAAIGLAKNLLQVHQNTYALLVSTENITQNIYNGNDRSKLLSNCIFRVGGAAILLSNRPSDIKTGKYQLIHTVHTNTASCDSSYGCISLEEDSEGIKGITIGRSLVAVAVPTIQTNLAVLGRLILPISEKLRYLTNHVLRYFNLTDAKPYVPNFRKAVDHVFPHVGAKPVLDGLGKFLHFSEEDLEAARMTLYRFGNTSSSSVWYELAYAEAKGKINRGDRLWQIAFGSGFKCSSVIWKAIRSVEFEEANPWSDEIDKFPVDVSNIGPLMALPVSLNE